MPRAESQSLLFLEKIRCEVVFPDFPPAVPRERHRRDCCPRRSTRLHMDMVGRLAAFHWAKGLLETPAAEIPLAFLALTNRLAF